MRGATRRFQGAAGAPGDPQTSEGLFQRGSAGAPQYGADAAARLRESLSGGLGGVYQYAGDPTGGYQNAPQAPQANNLFAGGHAPAYGSSGSAGGGWAGIANAAMGAMGAAQPARAPSPHGGPVVAQQTMTGRGGNVQTAGAGRYGGSPPQNVIARRRALMQRMQALSGDFGK